MVSLDGAMEHVLKDDTLHDSDKVIRYVDTMQKYMDYQNQYNAPYTQVAPSAATGPLQTHNEVNTDLKQDDSDYSSINYESLSKTDDQVHVNQENKEGDTNNTDNGHQVNVVKDIPVKKIKEKKVYFFNKHWLECK